MSTFTHYRQLDAMDCGPTCLRMVAKHHGQAYSIQRLREASQIGKEGVNLLGISEAAERIGFRTLAVKVSLAKLATDAPLPCIVHWNQNHFVVVYKATKTKVHVADPGSGLLVYNTAEFESRWAADLVDGAKSGVALLLEPTPAFLREASEKTANLSFGMLAGYLLRYKKLILQLGLGLLVGTALQLVLPLLTQSVVDVGIQTRNLHFIYLVLAAQLMLFMGRMSVDFIRSWILLHISTRINLSILSDFLGKLLRLPLSFFEAKTSGDIMQRIGDHQRIESFLTGTSLNLLFSFVNILVFSMVLVGYSTTIFGVFMLGSVLYAVWIVLFLGYRRQLDHKRFALAASSQNALIQLVQSVPELKLNNAELKKRWDWENLQVRNFKISVQSLALQQYQQTGAMVLNEGKNIAITFLAASAVVQGQLSIGGMMAMQYIIGQLNSPIEQLIQFSQHYQDAKISLERLNEIHEVADEDPITKTNWLLASGQRDLTFKNLSFAYAGAGKEPVIKNLSLNLPAGKVTAIVGSSGSGKTTLLKLLLKFYEPQSGDIYVGSSRLKDLSAKEWRKKCGSVMQDGFVFSDTIAENIALSDTAPNPAKLQHAVEMANIGTYIESLPLGYNTKIGAEGSGLSQGQKQRLLIARAVYKNPDYLFFDEATNALDANNERVIIENLAEFFKGRTVVVVAHRLSTVKNADQIVVLEKGEIVEIGNHAELSQRHGRYYELVKNQLEMSN